MWFDERVFSSLRVAAARMYEGCSDLFSPFIIPYIIPD
jgi:hypothetical protein